MIRRLVTGAALVSALGLTVAGCGSGNPPNTAPRADPAAIAWADKVCAGVATASGKLSNPPAVNSPDPRVARDAMVTFLTSVSAALDDMAGGIRNAGLPPVPGGQATVDKATDTLTQTKNEVDATQVKMKQASVTDQATLQKAIGDADSTMKQLSDPEGPIKDLKANPGLTLAFSQSATCQRVYGADA